MQAVLFFPAHRTLWFLPCPCSQRVMRGMLLAWVLGLAACASDGPCRIDLMPAPDVYQEGRIDPFA